MRILVTGSFILAALTCLAPAARAAPPSSEGVVVTGKRPLRACGDRDTGCIMAVAKALWQDFPRQIDTYCTHQAMARERQVADYEDFLGSSLDLPLDDGLPPALKMVCDAKPKDGDKNLGLALSWLPWARIPSPAEIAAAYPHQAPSTLGGDAHINCSLSSEGHLRDCVLVDETPQQQGFGVAGLRLSSRFTARIAKERDHSYLHDVRINVAVHFPPQGGAGAERTVDPDWTRTPDPERTASLYPDAAAKAGVATGVGRVACRIDDRGTLGGCKVVGEEPAGLGFGAAAMAAAPSLHANLWTRAGEPAAGGVVTVPLRFNAPTAVAPAAAEPAKATP